MDYCHPCRRHLNGALACPGCGLPADRLPLEPSYDEPAGYAGGVPGGSETLSDGDGTRGAGSHADSFAGGSGEEAPAPRPRQAPRRAGTSRRDRKAAAHRRRRRRTMLVTAGFLLAAGGLSLAELGLDAPGSPSQPTAAEGQGEAGVDGGRSERTAGASADPVSDRTDPSASGPGASPSASRSSASPSASTSASPSASESSAPSQAPTRIDRTGTTAPAPAPTTEPPADTPAPADPAPTPTDPSTPPPPDPTPSETCDRFLWWCT
ncbi:SCO2400 family protein [Streptomyces sp. enrichment culture]|uniref:SCO2400 family protein n=1 Tax=Streptomyces sp. enrichment culture TaxID=1795815 RepID=UPI003F56A6BD